MSETKPGKQLRDRIIKGICVVGILIVSGACIGPLILTMYRTTHYTPIARQMAKEAQAEFPKASFQGSYGSQTHLIRITVIYDSELDVDALKSWLRAKRAEKKIGASISVMLPNTATDLLIDP